MMIKKIILFAISSMFPVLLFSQNIIRGTITDGNNEPLIGVNVVVEGTTIGTVSDNNGHYIIETEYGKFLVFSYIGFESIGLKVTSDILNVVLTDIITSLDEVVAIGYGTIKNSRVTSALSKVRADQINKRPVARIDQAIQGKIPGVYVQETSGSPGKALNVRVRGIGSINYGTAPLYVIDGFPISGDLSSIAPSDITSIEVLKDASSAAIYGSRGSNGVVLITTKSGGTGKSNIDFNISYGIQNRFSKVDVLNREQYIEFAIEERINSYNYIGGDLSVPEDKRQNFQYAIDPLWRTNPTSFPDHDWQNLISRTALIQNYSLSVSGGKDNSKYFISANYIDQKGILIETNYKRLSFRANGEISTNKYISVGLNLSANMNERNDPDTDTNYGPVSRSILVAPIVGLNQQTINGGFYHYHAHFYMNPIALSRDIVNLTKGNDFLSNFYVNINILDNLMIKSSIGTNIINYNNNYFRSSNINSGNPAYGSTSNDLTYNLLTEHTINYNLEKGDWVLNLLAGYTFQKERYENSSLRKSNFPDEDIKTLNVATKLDRGTSSASEWILMSYLARASFSYLEKYIFNTSIRRDGSSRFGRNSKWGIFPSFSGGWLISEEPYMNRVKDFISNMKLRVSYGEVGNNNIGNYSSIGLLEASSYVFGDNKEGGYAPSTYSNPDLGWETTQTTNLGLDVGFLNNRMNLSFDYYIANIKDLLLNVPIPGITGFQTALQNIGRVQNKGFELELLTRNITGDFNWNTEFNFSFNENRVKKLGRDGSAIIGYYSGFPITKTEIGQPIGYYYLFKTDGLFKDEEDCRDNKNMSYANKNPQPGDIKYKDMNGDGIIDDEDRTNVGSNIPKITWGLTNSFSYKGFELSVFLDGVPKAKLLNMGKKETVQSRGNLRAYWLDRWRSIENPGNGKVPRAATTDNLNTPSDWWLEDASFWRIRNINLSYTLPKKIMNKQSFMNSCRIYAGIDNVYMHDHYNHMPQNSPINSSSLTPGIDYDSGYPLARTIQVGLNINF